MAKPFYSMDEVCQLLGKSADEIRELVRHGTLREFRDAGKVFFKAEDVDKMAGEAQADTGDIVLEPADDELPTLADSGSGSSIGLEPMAEEVEEGPKEDTVITASGIGVFDDDELEIDVDPMAKTQITTGTIGDQVSLEGAGSGSGLLDLSREADDTSLGAELLDEIYPGEEEATEAEAEPAAAEAEEEAEEEADESELEGVGAGEVLAPVMAVTGDPAEGLFSGLLVGALILLGVAGSVAASVFQGYLPDYARFLTENFYFFLGGAALVVVLSLIIGWFLGRATNRPRRG